MKGLVIIPTFNEKENIENIIEKVFSLNEGFHVLIVDDNSPDGTADIVKKLMLKHDGLLAIEERQGKMGLGTAYIHGFKWALERDYELVYEMDADFSHRPKDLLELRSAIIEDGGDVAIGSRYINGVNVVNWPMSRVMLSYFASMYVRIITGMKIQDTTAGFKCYRRIVLETIDLDKIKFKGYAFQIEMKFRAWKHGFNVIERPIVFTDRRVGESKMSKGIIKEAVFGVLKMKIASLFTTYKQVEK
ncbi:MAG: polyprenol monophosphomannose synthase [Flavobacteriales bacterium]|nr:polyprenol monophosphomannose synthase [Flavobacteriales bacterium]